MSRQMTRMVLLQSLTMSLSLFIATVQIIYQQITMNISKDSLRTAQDNIFNTVANLLTYVNYFGDFYIYLFSSESLRRNLKNILMNREKTQSIGTNTRFTRNQLTHTRTNNQIQPITTNNN